MCIRDRSKKFVVKAGFMEGKVMDAAETNAIAKLPNREGMLSMFAGDVYKRQPW